MALTPPFPHSFTGNLTADILVAGALGNLEGVRPWKVFGRAGSVSSTPQTVWDHGGIYQWPNGATTMTISSDDAEDDADGGTGATHVYITGLDANYEWAEEEVALSGLTPVTLSRQYTRILGMYVSQVGVTTQDASNAGDIYVGEGTVTSGVPDTVYGLINVACQNSSLMALVTVPADYTCLVFDYYASSAKSTGEVTFDSVITSAGTNIPRLVRRVGVIANEFHYPNRMPFVFPEMTDIEIRATAAVAGTPASAGFDALFVPNSIAKSWR